MERDGRPRYRAKMDTFKVADLSEIVLTDQAFTPTPGFNATNVKYTDKIICVVQVV